MKRIISIFLCIILLCGVWGCTKNRDVTSSDASLSTSQGGEQVESGESSAQESDLHNTDAPHSSTTKKGKEWFTEGDVVFTSADLKKAQNQKYVKPKNVIVLIGDGMGLNDITIAKKFDKKLFDFGLVLDNLPNKGIVTTKSLSGVTDSAAAATALATGVKTYNGYVGIDSSRRERKNPVELARELGKRVGVVTNDVIHGATPAAFTVHSTSRGSAQEILSEQALLAPDVLIGDMAGYGKFESAVPLNLRTKLNVAKINTVWNEKLNEDPLCKKAFFGFMGVNHNQNSNLLAQATQLALNRLENDKGFFLMVECATTDKGGHDNDVNKKIAGVSNLDKAVAVAVKYCISHPDTVLIVTSDHETGGVSFPTGRFDVSDVKFTTTNHTNSTVGVFALGYGTEIFKSKTVDNTDIGNFILAALKGQAYKPVEKEKPLLKTIRVENQNLHMQGFTSDKENMYFSFTDSLVKTNSSGTVEKQVPIGGGHLGDIDYYNGKIYGSFMKEPLKGRPWYEWTGFELYVFDAKTLALEKSVNLDVCDNYFSVLGTAGDTRGFNGIDGITIAPDPVTGKDKIFIACSIDSNEKYKNQILLQLSLDGKYEKEHYIPTGNTVYGIQNLDYDAQTKEFWFSTYAPEHSYQPKEMLYCVSGDLKTIKAKYAFFTGYGIDCLGNNRYYVSYEFGVNGDKGGEARLCDRKSFS